MHTDKWLDDVSDETKLLKLSVFIYLCLQECELAQACRMSLR